MTGDGDRKSDKDGAPKGRPGEATSVERPPWARGAGPAIRRWRPGLGEESESSEALESYSPRSNGNGVGNGFMRPSADPVRERGAGDSDEGPAHEPPGKGAEGDAGEPAPTDGATKGAPAPCPQCEMTRAEADRERELLRQYQARYARRAQELARIATEFSQRLSQDVVELAFRLAEKIVQHAAEVDRATVVSNLQRALAAVGVVDQLTIRCHPADLAILRAKAPELAQDTVGQPVTVSVQASDDLDRGDSIVLFDKGLVDARLDVQLNRLVAEVRTAVAEHYGPGGGPDESEEG